jgi:hypothetical protein
MIQRAAALLFTAVLTAGFAQAATPPPAASGSSPAPAASAAVPSAATAAAAAPAAAASPHGQQVPTGPQNSSDLAPGVIEVLVHDPDGNPLGNTPVELGILHSSIEQGDSRSERTVLSDPLGKVSFAGLPTTTDFSYRATIQIGPAQFGTDTFSLRREFGHREILTVYPVTRNQKDAHVVGRGVIAVHPRDDVFIVDVLYQLINVGQIAWVPEGLVLKLPSGWKAFSAQEATGDTAFQEAGDVGAKLVGTFTPGSHEVGFRFQLTNPHEASLAMTMPLFPRTVEMRVIVDAASEMSLRVANYGESFADRMRTGQRVLVAQRNYLELRENSPDTLSISIGGMRTRGNGHYWAAGIALGIALFGLWNAWQQPRQPARKSKLASADLQRARELLLDELVALEQARETKAIGTKAYDQTRHVLLTSLARLESSAAT